MTVTTEERRCSPTSTVSKDKEKTPPDGGWGWMVAIGISLMFISTTAQYSSFALLFEGILDRLGAHMTGAALIINTLAAAVNSTGLVTNFLLKSTSYRILGVIGSLLFAVGVCLTTFADSVIQIIIPYSIVAGVGLGLLAPSSYFAFNSYFMERRPLAKGLCQLAIAIGFIIGPPLVQSMMEKYGYEGTMLLLGGIGLNSVVGAILFQPVRWNSCPTFVTVKEEADGMEDIPLGKIEAERSSVAVLEDNNLNMAVVPDEEDDLTKEQSTGKQNYKLNGLNQIQSEDMECEEHMVISRRGSLVMSAMLDYRSQLLHLPIDEEGGASIYRSTTEIVKDTARGKSSEMKYLLPVSLGNFSSNVLMFDNSIIEMENVQREPLISGLQKRKRQISRHLDHHSHHRPLLEQIPDDEVPDDEINPVPLLPRNKQPSILHQHVDAVFTFLDFSLLTDIVYVNIVLGLSISFVCHTNFFLLYPFYLFSLGVTGNDIALYMSTAAGADVIARLALPWLAGTTHVSPRMVYLLACFASAIARSCIVLIDKSFTLLMTMSAIVGFLQGATVINLSLVISQYCSVDQFSVAYRLYIIINVILTLTIGPLIGVLRDSTGSFALPIHVLSVTLMVCVVAWLSEYLVLWRRESRISDH